MVQQYPSVRTLCVICLASLAANTLISKWEFQTRSYTNSGFLLKPLDSDSVSTEDINQSEHDGAATTSDDGSSPFSVFPLSILSEFYEDERSIAIFYSKHHYVPFHKPWWLTFTIFLAMSAGIFVWIWDEWGLYKSSYERASTSTSSPSTKLSFCAFVYRHFFSNNAAVVVGGGGGINVNVESLTNNNYTSQIRPRASLSYRSLRFQQFLHTFPAFLFDLFASIFLSAGLIFLSASVWQMLRGFSVVAAWLIAVFCMKQRTCLWNWCPNGLGVTMCCGGLFFVGLATIMVSDSEDPIPNKHDSSQYYGQVQSNNNSTTTGSSESHSHPSSTSEKTTTYVDGILGISLTLIGLLFSAAQVSAEEMVMRKKFGFYIQDSSQDGGSSTNIPPTLLTTPDSDDSSTRKSLLESTAASDWHIISVKNNEHCSEENLSASLTVTSTNFNKGDNDNLNINNININNYVLLPPCAVVGFMGLWGVLSFVVFIFPLLSQLNLEDTVNTLTMIYNSPNCKLLILNFLYILSVLLFNLSRMSLTKQTSAVVSLMIGSSSTLLIWATNLAVCYIPEILFETRGWDQYGERWDPVASPLQLVGFLCFVAGQCVYAGLITKEVVSRWWNRYFCCCGYFSSQHYHQVAQSSESNKPVSINFVGQKRGGRLLNFSA